MFQNLKLARLFGSIVAAGLVATLAVGCGGDDGGGSKGSSGQFSSKCNQVCQLQTDGSCNLLSQQDCVDFCTAFEGADAGCRAALETTMDCQIAGGSTTACSADACQAEMDAQTPACG